MGRRWQGISYANVVSTLALFVALGGTAVATGVLDGKKIKKGSITGRQIKAGSVPGADLKPDTVRGKQILERSLGKVPHATLADAATSAATAEAATRATSAESADTAAALSPGLIAQLTDRCPDGTTAYAGSCFESSTRGPATWPVAAMVCGEAGSRLPDLSELEGFRQQPGVALSGNEHTGTYLDLNGLDSGGGFTVAISDAGVLSPGYVYGSSNARYRCVFPASNG